MNETYQVVEPRRPQTYPDLLRAVGEVTDGHPDTDDYAVDEWAFRGLANSDWTSASSLWRELTADAAPQPSESTLAGQERIIGSMARNWMRTEGLPGGLKAANLLAHLQHHGAPTRLLDLTANPLTRSVVRL